MMQSDRGGTSFNIYQRPSGRDTESISFVRSTFWSLRQLGALKSWDISFLEENCIPRLIVPNRSRSGILLLSARSHPHIRNTVAPWHYCGNRLFSALLLAGNQGFNRDKRAPGVLRQDNLYRFTVATSFSLPLIGVSLTYVSNFCTFADYIAFLFSPPCHNQRRSADRRQSSRIVIIIVGLLSEVARC